MPNPVRLEPLHHRNHALRAGPLRLTRMDRALEPRLPRVLEAWNSEQPALEQNGARLLAALTGLAEADQASPLDAPDLDRLATAAHLIGLDDVSAGAREVR